MQTIQAYINEQLGSGKRPNRLIREKSPYLLQHAFNPVEWFPWGEEAFRAAGERDLPIFLSVGYSTCYWCHVMERQVFEDPEIARLMNERLISVKVDREERPDVDSVYMAAVQALTGRGGWPMSVFLNHKLEPFYGGTYFPPRSQGERPGFAEIVRGISEAWRDHRNDLVEAGVQVAAYLAHQRARHPETAADGTKVRKAFEIIRDHHDPLYGGFGRAPKFPRPAMLNFLMRYYSSTAEHSALDMTLTTLRRMAAGGIHDHLGGGFHRYSVDSEWLVPHFEKMLYDQAQLAVSYLEAFQASAEEFFASVSKDILTYVLRNLTRAEGGFYSAEDAESAPEGQVLGGEKQEGAFYLWTESEIDRLLPAREASVVKHLYGILTRGNVPTDPHGVFRGKNILHEAHTPDETAAALGIPREDVQTIIANSRRVLFSSRENRAHPHLDDKILTGWNGLMISALAKAYQVLRDREYLDSAEHAARFLSENLYDRTRERLYRRYRDGEARFEGSSQDYAFSVQAFLDLYEASFRIEWLEFAIRLAEKHLELFWDDYRGGFFDTTGEDSSLILRTKGDYDGAEPSGSSVAALNLLRLSRITNSPALREKAERTMDSFTGELEGAPESLPALLSAVIWRTSGSKEIVIAGRPEEPGTERLLGIVHSMFIPEKVILLADGGEGQRRLSAHLPFLEDMKPLSGKPTAYICHEYACQSPTSEPEELARLLAEGRVPG